MKRILKLLPLLLAVLAFTIMLPWPAHTSTTTLTGTIKDSQGNPLNGQIVLQLPVPATDVTTGTAVANTPVAYRIVNGVILSGSSVPLYDVANLQPQNLYYAARVYDSSGTLVFAGNYAITGTSYNLGAAIPTNVTTSNISYVNPAVTNAPNVFCCTQTFQGQIVSTLATGTAPFSISSTTLVPNLNVNDINGVVISGTPSIGQVVTATSPSTANWQATAAVTSSYTNNGITGTGTNLLAKLTGAPSTATATATTDTSGAIGICISGCGVGGTGVFTTVGQASCVFDGATVAGDYVQISSTVGGNCHDGGNTYPASGQVLGRVLSTNGGGGTYNMTLFGVEIQGSSPTLTNVSFTSKTLGGDVGFSTNVLQTIDSITINSWPGCGTNKCRVRIYYSYMIANGNNTGQCYINDGTNLYAESGETTSGSQAFCSSSMISPTQFSSGSGSVTFTSLIFNSGNGTVKATSSFGTAVPSRMQAEVILSN